MFIPHYNSFRDNYDILNPESDNVLCLFVSVLKDNRYMDRHLFLGYFDESRLSLYKDFCLKYNLDRITFFNINSRLEKNASFNKCPLIFTDETFLDYPTKLRSQKIVCLNYYSGFMKNDFFRIKEHGGFRRLLKEQKRMYKYYDNIVTTSDICSMFMSVEDCVYYGNLVPLGFPRNDVFYQDNSKLKTQMRGVLDIDFDNVITYVPTHRDYENFDRRDFYDKESLKPRTLFGPLSNEEIALIDKTLESTNSIVIAKVHPMQVRKNLLSGGFRRVIYYHDLVKKINTSLYPILAITDCLLTDYTTTIYDFLMRDKPVIYYFYDIEKFAGTRGLFINPIDPLCVGSITYNITELCNQIMYFASGSDIYKDKRKTIKELLIKNLDGHSSERIKNYYLNNPSIQ